MKTEGFLSLTAIAPRLSGERGADRMFVVGRSGSGKSYFVRALLELYGNDKDTPKAYRGYIVIFDPNHNFNYPGRIVSDPTRVEPSKSSPVVIYRPDIQYLNAEGWNEALKVLFRSKQPILLVIDEFTAMDTLFSVKRLEGGNYLTAYLTRGRALGKAAIIVTQSPSAIPLNAIRNSELFVYFDLPLAEDRERMSGIMPRYAIEVNERGEAIQVDIRNRKALGRYQFWFYGPNVEDPVRIRLAA